MHNIAGNILFVVTMVSWIFSVLWGIVLLNNTSGTPFPRIRLSLKSAALTIFALVMLLIMCCLMKGTSGPYIYNVVLTLGIASKLIISDVFGHGKVKPE